MMKRLGLRLAAVAFVVLLDQAASARPCDIEMNPNEVDSFSVDYIGRTLSAVVVTVTQTAGKTNDTAASDIVSALSVSGSKGNFTLSPAFACGTPRCRAGNAYHLEVQATDSDGNTPVKNLLACFKRERWRPTR